MSFETIIGLEIHAELKTKSKIFCGCSTEFASEPNANTCPVCLGHPGTLPVLNGEAVRLAVKAGMALGCKVNYLNRFDRKTTFTPTFRRHTRYPSTTCRYVQTGLLSSNAAAGT